MSFFLLLKAAGFDVLVVLGYVGCELSLASPICLFPFLLVECNILLCDTLEQQIFRNPSVIESCIAFRRTNK